MSDVTSMLAANLVEAFKQLNQFVTLGPCNLNIGSSA